VVIRNVAGAHEEEHTFNLHGHRWLNEPDNPSSAINDNQALSLAEYFNYEIQGSGVVKGNATKQDNLRSASNSESNGTPSILQGGAGRPGDYLYADTALDWQWLGAWGLFRVPAAEVNDLKALPDRLAEGEGPDTKISPWPALAPGDPVTQAKSQGVNICPTTAPKRVYDVTALKTKITYNPRTGDHDPNGLLYAPTSDVETRNSGVASLKSGKKPEPLFVRANAGDCVEMTLRNGLSEGGLPAHDAPSHKQFEDDEAFPTGNRVSMHPSLVKSEVTRSDGATVGFNYDQTVAPGKSLTYRWYVDPALDSASTNLVDFGDRRGHRHHGLFGGLLVEPKGSKWTDPITGTSLEGTRDPKTGRILGTKTAEAADITGTDSTGAKFGFREFVADLQDGLGLKDSAGDWIPEAGHVDDAYELGNRGINYRTERFAPRLKKDPERAFVMSSEVHGDPATPVFRSKVGDPVKFRLLQGGDRARAHTFSLNGHEWPNQFSDPSSLKRSSQDGVMPGRAFTFPLVNGAGGRQVTAGDYLFRDGSMINNVNAGLWGLLRAEPKSVNTGLKPLP